MFIYDRMGTCLYYQEWNKDSPLRKKKKMNELLSDQKLMYGLLFSLKVFVNGIAPKPFVVVILQRFQTNTISLSIALKHFIVSKPIHTKCIFMNHQQVLNL